EAHTEKPSPPVLKPRPLRGMALGIVAGADVRVRRAQVPVDQRHGETRRAIVDVDVRLTAIERYRDLNRRSPPLFAVVERITLVVDDIVGTALELPRALQHLAGVRCESRVHPK